SQDGWTLRSQRRHTAGWLASSLLSSLAIRISGAIARLHVRGWIVAHVQREASLPGSVEQTGSARYGPAFRRAVDRRLLPQSTCEERGRPILALKIHDPTIRDRGAASGLLLTGPKLESANTQVGTNVKLEITERDCQLCGRPRFERADRHGPT